MNKKMCVWLRISVGNSLTWCNINPNKQCGYSNVIPIGVQKNKRQHFAARLLESCIQNFSATFKVKDRLKNRLTIIQCKNVILRLLMLNRKLCVCVFGLTYRWFSFSIHFLNLAIIQAICMYLLTVRREKENVWMEATCILSRRAFVTFTTLAHVLLLHLGIVIKNGKHS